MYKNSGTAGEHYIDCLVCLGINWNKKIIQDNLKREFSEVTKNYIHIYFPTTGFLAINSIHHILFFCSLEEEMSFYLVKSIRNLSWSTTLCDSE